MPIEISFVDKTQPGQSQHLVDGVDVLGSTGDELGETAGGDRACPGAKFSDHAFEDAVDQTDVAVVKTKLNVIDGPGSDDFGRFFDIDARKPGSFGE